MVFPGLAYFRDLFEEDAVLPFYFCVLVLKKVVSFRILLEEGPEFDVGLTPALPRLLAGQFSQFPSMTVHAIGYLLLLNRVLEVYRGQFL